VHENDFQKNGNIRKIIAIFLKKIMHFRDKCNMMYIVVTLPKEKCFNEQKMGRTIDFYMHRTVIPAQSGAGFRDTGYTG
jgi:hypothetical protein